MDRRMYRGSAGNNYGNNRNASPYRMGEHERHEHVCDDVCDRHMPEDSCGRHMPEDSCGRDNRECELKNCPLAMCYVPWQVFRNLYENEFVALERGTIFKELDLDWYGRGCK